MSFALLQTFILLFIYCRCVPGLNIKTNNSLHLEPLIQLVFPGPVRSGYRVSSNPNRDRDRLA